MKERDENNGVNDQLPQGAAICSPAPRKNWVNSRNKQRVVLLGDNSGSMAGAKAAQAHAGLQQLIENLAQPVNRNGFHVGVVYFNNDASIVHPWTFATALVSAIAPLNPGGYTNIAAAFEKALTMLEEAQKQDEQQNTYVYLRPALFFYSDGQNTKGDDPRQAAEKVKVLADVVTIAIGADADQTLLQDLATSPAHAYQVSNAAELRKILAEAGATVTQSFQRGEDATHVITKLQNG